MIFDDTSTRVSFFRSPIGTALRSFAVSDIDSALKLGDQEFYTGFGFEKPRRLEPVDEQTVLYCMSGFRARKAQTIFENFGFNNTRVYDGSFEDWVHHGGKVVP